MGHTLQDTQLYLHVGLGNGMVLRTIIDSITGQLSDTRSRYIGSKGAKLFPGVVIGGDALLALSSRTWIAYNYLGRHYFTPLSYEPLELAAAFSSDHCEEGFIGVADKTLRIFMIEKFGEIFNSSVLPLRYTPRKMEINPHNKTLVVLEAEHNSFPVEQREKFKTALEPQEDDENDEYKIGTPKAGPGIWASCIRVVDPKRLETVDLVELSNNECAVSVCVCNFLMNEQEMFVVVGTAKDMTLYPRTISGASVSVFKTNNLNRLEVVYKFQVEDVPLALCPFYGKLLVGVGKFLRIYEMGKKKMLKKSENKATFPNLICNIKVDDQRIFVSDISESISVLVHRKEDDQIYCFADDVVSRWLSTFAVLDHNTVAAVDKFENFFVLRLPAACEEDEKDIGSVKYKWEAGFLNGAYYKMEHIAHFYLGDLATSLQKCCLGEGGPEILLYATTMGALAALVPLTKKEEVEFFIHLEMYLRQENKPLLGRDHMAFRSFSMPVRNVIDGDLCEQFSVLDFEKQRSLCEELGHPQNEIFKRLEDIKNRIF
jgi:splicing factor 3B subunit 3